MKSRVGRRRGITKIRTKTNQRLKKTVEKINETKTWFFENTNKIDKPLDSPIWSFFLSSRLISNNLINLCSSYIPIQSLLLLLCSLSLWGFSYLNQLCQVVKLNSVFSFSWLLLLFLKVFPVLHRLFFPLYFHCLYLGISAVTFQQPSNLHFIIQLILQVPPESVAYSKMQIRLCHCLT